MAEIEYKTLSTTNKINAVKNRLGQLEAEHYSRSLAYLGIQAPPELTQQQDISENQIQALQQELAKLEQGD